MTAELKRIFKEKLMLTFMRSRFRQLARETCALVCVLSVKNAFGTRTPRDIAIRLPYPLQTIISPHE